MPNPMPLSARMIAARLLASRTCSCTLNVTMFSRSAMMHTTSGTIHALRERYQLAIASLVIEALVHDLAVLPAADGNLGELDAADALERHVHLALGERDV